MPQLYWLLLKVKQMPGTEQMPNKCLMNESLLKNEDLTRTSAITIVTKCPQIYVALYSLKSAFNNSTTINLIT